MANFPDSHFNLPSYASSLLLNRRLDAPVHSSDSLGYNLLAKLRGTAPLTFPKRVWLLSL